MPGHATMKLFAVLVFSLFLMQAAAGSENPRLTVKDNPLDNGISDPSIEYDELGRGWLAYTSNRLPAVAETRLALSIDNGDTWAYVMTINASEPGTQISGNKGYAGVWRYENPSLLHDPADVPERRWKLFTQRTLSMEPHGIEERLYELGAIEYRTAPQPTGPWSAPVMLFCSDSGVCLNNLNRLHPDLAGMAWYTEAGSIVVDEVIYLSLDAIPASQGDDQWRQRRIILLASTDHGVSWEYRGTLTGFADAIVLGHLALTASSLVEEHGRYYLLVSPAGSASAGGLVASKSGIIAVEFEDIATARLHRNSDGGLILSKAYRPPQGSGGAGDFDAQNVNGGMLYSRMQPAAANLELFRIMKSFEPILVPDSERPYRPRPPAAAAGEEIGMAPLEKTDAPE